MVMLVTLEQASDHLRRDTTDDNADLTLKIMAASNAVINYLKSASPYELERDSSGDIIYDSSGKPVPVEDSSGNPVVLPEVELATLYLIGVYYKDRDGETMKEWQHGYLPFPVTSILYPLRKPACE